MALVVALEIRAKWMQQGQERALQQGQGSETCRRRVCPPLRRAGQGREPERQHPGIEQGRGRALLVVIRQNIAVFFKRG